MREIKFVVKAEQQEKLLQSAGFIVSEKILFGTEFGDGMLTFDKPIIESNQSLQSYIFNNIEIDEGLLRNMLDVKASTAVGMFELSKQLNKGWTFSPVKAKVSDLSFICSFFDSDLIQYAQDEAIDYGSSEITYVNFIKNAFSVAELLCNYVPVSEAIIEISSILSKGTLSMGDDKHINQILNKIEVFPYLNFLNALESFSCNSMSDFVTNDNKVNAHWNKAS